jgi:hypothetical protein
VPLKQSRRARLYGITEEELMTMESSKMGFAQYASTPSTGPHALIMIIGLVRSEICSAIGLLRDNPAFMIQAADYCGSTISFVAYAEAIAAAKPRRGE